MSTKRTAAAVEERVLVNRKLADSLDEARRPKARADNRAPRSVTVNSTSAEDTPLSFESPESSTIEGASYDESTETLTITFKGQREYTYPAFPFELWREFTQAESKGQFFARRIRPIFTGRKM